jgi:hypothetical protein
LLKDSVSLNTAAPLHEELSYSLNVTVPVGLLPPETVAVSLIEEPNDTGEVALVEIAGVFGLTTDTSAGSLQLVEIEALLESPEYVATH